MKKKRFYDNKKRNQKWTEKPVGREIDFADKYSFQGSYSDKFDYKRPKEKAKKFSKVKFSKFLKRLVVVVLSFALIGVGYSFMDFYMLRVSYKERISTIENVESNENTLSQKATSFNSYYTDAVYFDNASMLDSVKTSVKNGGFNSVCVDIKRSDGTVAYNSKLGTVQSYMAVSSAASDFEGSLKSLKDDGITIIARIYCYKDSVVPSVNTTNVIIGSNGEPFIDENGSIWLNPQSKDTYDYIQNIIKEVYLTGVSYFILDGVEMPEELKAEYHSSFEELSTKLYSDLGYNVKFLNPEIVQVDVNEEKEISEDDLNNIAEKSNDGSQIFMISSAGKKKNLVTELKKKKITNYVVL